MLVTQVHASIEKHSMLVSGAKVIIAVSGGADSTALLSLLVQLKSEYDTTLVVAHVNHQVRGDEAEREALFVEQLARYFGLAFYQTRLEVAALQRTSGLSLQQAARHLRYRYLEQLSVSITATSIALGHTADDQAETLLLRLVRGSGPASLAGIPIVRRPFIRPLLRTSRQAILHYLRSQCLPWVEDSSNAHPIYLRNRVRHHVLPMLRQLNPQITQRLNHLADMLHADSLALEQQVEAYSHTIVTWQAAKIVDIHAEALRSLPVAIQRRLLRRLLDQLLHVDIQLSFRHIEALRSHVVTGHDKQRCTLPGGIWAEYQAGTVRIRNIEDLPAPTDSYALSLPGSVTIGALNICLTADVQEPPWSFGADTQRAFLAYERLRYPLRVRFRQPGDKFYPLGSPGSKKLRDFYIERRIPQGERPYIPLVVSGQEIVWVVGYRIAEPFKIRSETRQVVLLQYHPITMPQRGVRVSGGSSKGPRSCESC
ncbi:MAG: tRNA lysidine(34) synthetase TilS [Candidatus Tectimicrobiota bacterium]